MKRTQRFSARSRCGTSLFLSFALLFSAAAGIPFSSAVSKVSSRARAQEQTGSERRVAPLPPRTGPPAANLPNLDEVKHRQVQAPRAATALPSTIRSRRKPLESRNGRRVGDPLPPRVRPTPVATPSGLPTPVPSPRHDELARFESPLSHLPKDPVFRYLAHPFFSRRFLTPLSDSSSPLFGSRNTSFDVAPAPIPQAGGSKIVFASGRDGFMQIYVMNSDGTGQTRLTADGSNNENPRCSPNGTKILFQSDRDNPGSGLRDIYVMNSNGSGQTRLTTDANDDCNAAWSSDGTKIVFQSLRNTVSYQIYTMNADGSGQANVSNNGVNDIQPSWSPDGTKVAFASERDQAGFPSVYVMNANGTNQTRLTFSGVGLRDEQPVWSPNGSKIAFTSTRNSMTDSWTETDDYEIPEDDGQTFPKSRVNINKEVYLMNTDGSGQTRLTNDLSNDDSPTWSPDGAKIVFRSERERDLFDATPQLWTMNVDGSGQTNLSNSGDSDFSPSWTSGSANQPPVAVPGGPYSGVVSQNAPFSGSGSYDPDGTIVSYSWTFGDGGTGSGVAPYHAYATTGTFTATLTVTDNLGAQATASTTINVSASSSDQYATSFLQWALGRPPNTEETTYWTDIFRAAYPKGLSSMKLASRELGMTVFESAEYAARNRNDHWYVYDLYKTFLMREPDVDGWAYWEAAIPIYGRDQIRRGFDESTEFANIVATLTASGSPSSNVSSLATALADPFNQSGNQLQARDAEWSANLLSLPGRAGLDLGLSVSYSSLVFTRSGPYSYFDADNGSPSPGFHIGFPTIQDKYFDAQVGANVYLLKTAAGRRVELRQVGTSNVYESADSSYLQLTYSGNLTLRTTDGTTLNFGWTGINEYRCTWIRDRNGNYMLINYDWRGDLQNVTDTLGRVIAFIYDTNNNLSCVTQGWNGQPAPTTCGPAHTWATFGWENLPMQPTLSGVVGTYQGETIPVLKMVGFDDGTYTKFLYSGNGQVTRITQYASDSNPLTDTHERSHTVFNYNAGDDATRLTDIRVAAEYWTGFNGVPNEVTTQLGVEGDKHTVTVVGDPNGTVYKESYAGSSSPAWQRGLVLQSEVWSAGVQRKLSTVSWTQDNPNVNYKTNPRVTQTIVSDGANVRKTTIDYSVAAYAQYGLPYFVTEYAADGQTELRRTYRDYNLSQQYLEQRIIGLVAAVHLTDASGYQAKVTYGYDDPARLSSQANNATMHDQSYHDSFFVRGNVTNVTRWDVTNMNTIVDPSKALTTYMNYNAAGSVISSTDPAGHTNSVSYSDAFSANGTSLDAQRSLATFAYPTSLTDADNFTSSVWYHYDFGAKTRVEGPPPNNQPNGIIQTFAYDSSARLQRTTTANTGAYTHYVYGPNFVQSYSSVNNVAANYWESDLYSITVFDGVGRDFTTTTNHPGSAGGYKLVNVIFDRMGRPFRQSNPTEVNSSWLPAGDDAYNPATAEGGVRYSVLDFDWQGRTTRTTHPDGAYKEASYAGCGCAGGEVVSLTDEVNRQQKVYSDVLGRTWKTEVLNWDASVYSTTTNTFNARDQVTLVRQFAGTDQSQTHQDTTMSYDGYGRLQSKHVPQQQDASGNPTYTTWAYNPDDTIQSVIDARGASASYVYNNGRHLVNEINYNAPAGITPTPNVTFGYDAVGNRTSMTEGLGSQSYGYDSLSRMTSETRTFNGLGTFTLGYDYNFAGELKSITDPFNATINYGHDATGRLSSVSGTSFAGVTSYATGVQYRAWGAVKSLSFGNNRTLSASYNSRLQAASISGVFFKAYQYYADGSLRYSQDWGDDCFDRSYAYDHVSRIETALSGPEARGEPPSDNRPYNQSFAYDAFNHLTSQVGRHWSQGPNSSDSSFINNRRVGSDYDADGNVLSGNGTYTYNAAGQIAVVQWGTDNTVQGFDGNGLRVKTTETTVSNGQSATEVRYYVRSTVLGGQVVTEMNASGGKQRTFVYAGGRVLAWQRILSGVQRVTWEHRDPSNASFHTTNEDGTVNAGPNYVGDGASAELDPSGANAGRFDPYLPEPPPEENQGSLISYGSFGDAGQLGTTYSWDGIPMLADELFQMVNQLMHGRFGIAQALMRGTRVSGTREFLAIGHDSEGTFPNIVVVHGFAPIFGTDPMAMGLLFAEPQKPKGERGSGHGGGKATPIPCDVVVPTDMNDRDMLATLMGEAFSPGDRLYTYATNDGRGNSSHEAAKHPDSYATRDDIYMEMQYMVSVFENRHRDWGLGSWSDIAHTKQKNGEYQFEGYPDGLTALNHLGSINSRNCERARLGLTAIEAVKAFGPINRDVHWWHGVLQWDDNKPPQPFVRVRNGALRIGGSDFW